MDSTHTMNQTRGVPCWRAFVQPSFDEHLLERILSPDNLRDAFERVESNKGAPGVDGMKVEDFREWAKEHWPGVVQSIRDGSYVPSPVRRKEIPKDRCKNPKYRKGPKRHRRNSPRRKDVCRNKGKVRRLGIPTVLDRTIQQAISQVLTPMFDPTFSKSSFGFRPCRSAHQALKQIQSYIREGYNTAVDVDLEASKRQLIIQPSAVRFGESRPSHGASFPAHKGQTRPETYRLVPQSLSYGW